MEAGKLPSTRLDSRDNPKPQSSMLTFPSSCQPRSPDPYSTPCLLEADSSASSRVSDDEEDPAGQRHRFHLPARENDDEAVALQAIVAACLGGVPRAPVGAVLANGRTVPPFHPNYFTLDFSLSVTSDAVLISYYFLSLASNKQTKPRYVARQVQL